MPESSSLSIKTVAVITSATDISSSLDRLITQFQGKLHQCIGQLIVLLFSSPVEACQALMTLQKEIPSTWKGGIAEGQFAEAMEEATRLESAVRLGEIAISPGLTYTLAGSEISWTSVGKRQFAGMTDAIELNVIGRVRTRVNKTEDDPFDVPIDLLIGATPPSPKMEDESLVRIASKIASDRSRFASSETIPLAEENPQKLSAKKIPLAIPRPPIEPRVKVGDRAKRLFLLLLISIGTALAVHHGRKWLEEKDSYDREGEVKKRLENSEVLQSMKTKRLRPLSSPAPSSNETSLTVNSTPPGAEVWIDHVRVKGKTPVKIGGITPGVVAQVEIRKAGYESSLQWISLERGEERELSLHLLRLTHSGNPAK